MQDLKPATIICLCIVYVLLMAALVVGAVGAAASISNLQERMDAIYEETLPQFE